MNIKDQVVDLKGSQKMEKLGFPQEGIWWWVKETRKSFGEPHWLLVDRGEAENWDEDVIAAPTVAEMGLVLPEHLSIKANVFQLHLDILKINKNWIVSYRIGCAKAEIRIEAKTLANAMAAMWCYLVENKLIEVK